MNVSDHRIQLDPSTQIGLWLPAGHVPRKPGFVRPGSARATEWSNLAFEATTDMVEGGVSADPAEDQGPLTEKIEYRQPKAVLMRDSLDPSFSLTRSLGPGVDSVGTSGEMANSEVKVAGDVSQPVVSKPNLLLAVRAADVVDDQTGAEAEVVVHEGSDLQAEDFEDQLAILPDIEPPITKVRSEDIKVGDLTRNTPAEIERLRSIIWGHRRIMIGKGNAMPPAARGALYDIDAKPVAQRERKVRPEFLEKLFQLIKGLLSNRLTQPSR